MTGEWTVRGEKPNGEPVEHTEPSRSEAEARAEKAREVGIGNVTIEPPEETDGGTAPAEADPGDAITTPEQDDALAQLGEELETDPLEILPGHMVDHIQGQPAVNKRGYAMIAERYDIGVSADVDVYPWENDQGRCVAHATAVTDDGREYSGWATASSDDGDMEEQIIEPAETRSLKRAVSWASGVGIVSYQELVGELESGE